MKKSFGKLRGKMVELRVTQGDLAKELGISPSTLNLKLNGKREFTLSEIWRIKLALNLENTDAYFFSN